MEIPEAIMSCLGCPKILGIFLFSYAKMDQVFSDNPVLTTVPLSKYKFHKEMYQSSLVKSL